MRPNQLAKSDNEHSHQVAFFAWCAVARLHGFRAADEWAAGGELKHRQDDLPPAVPALEWIHAIPNGGSRGDSVKARQIRGAALKAEGVRNGVADIFLPYAVYPWHGLYIEMKRPNLKPKSPKAAGGLSIEQRKFGEYAKENRFGWVVCYGWQEAVSIIKSYLIYNRN